MNDSNSAMDRHGSEETMHQRPSVAPAVDIYENASELLVVADLPGVAQSGLAIHLDKGKLTLEGRRPKGLDDADTGWDFRRTFVIPRSVDVEGIAAELKNGVVTVHLPKLAEAKPRQIPIRTS
jgi:HSP20 family molecular chaperone IbpA